MLDATTTKAIARSHKVGRQIWIVWRNGSYRLQLAWRRGSGILVARVIGDDVLY